MIEIGKVPGAEFFRKLVGARSREDARRAQESKSPTIAAIHEIIQLLDNLHLGKSKL